MTGESNKHDIFPFLMFQCFTLSILFLIGEVMDTLTKITFLLFKFINRKHLCKGINYIRKLLKKPLTHLETPYFFVKITTIVNDLDSSSSLSWVFSLSRSLINILHSLSCFSVDWPKNTLKISNSEFTMILKYQIINIKIRSKCQSKNN